MTPTKKQKLSAAQPPRPTPTSAPTSGTSARKPWVKRTPVQVVLDQIHKQEERVADLQEQLSLENRELEKLHKAKEVLEAE
ncbi:MAG: hypothetical protein ACRD3Q_04455 [Terriglobales bacterium]